MARTDAVQFFLELAAEWRRLGAEVTFEPGWERRGNGQSAAYEGGVVHHTAFLSSFENPLPALRTLINGRPGLGGPLCNVAGPVCPVEQPRLHIVAAYPANHAGASGGRSMGPLPTTGLFNRVVVGLEIDYAGLTPMIGGQYAAALIFTKGLANVLQRSVEYIRAHAETSITGKWDIGVGNGRTQTIDMAAFRRDAANYAGEGGLPVGAAEDIAEIKGMLRGGMPAGESNFHWLERNTRQYEVFRSDPAQGGNGQMVLAHPVGVWYVMPDTGYYNLYISIGLCSPDYKNLHPNYFQHIADLIGLGAKAHGVDVASLAAELDKLADADLPATPPVDITMSDAQIEKLAQLLDDDTAAEWKARIAEQAKATADEFDARERARLSQTA